MAGHRLPGWRTPWLSPAAPARGEPCGVWLRGAQPLLLLAPKAVPQPQLLPFLSVPAPEPVACLCRTAPTVPESKGMGHIPCVWAGSADTEHNSTTSPLHGASHLHNLEKSWEGEEVHASSAE